MTEYRRHVRRVLVVTSSYPQVPGDGSGGFVHALNQRLVTRGLEVTVLAPASPISESRVSDGVDIRFVPYAPRAWQTLAHGSGVLINVRAHPSRLGLAPSLVGSLTIAAARGPRPDVVHAHWLPCAVIARASRAPRVVSVLGSDLKLAERAPGVLRHALGQAVALGVTPAMVPRLRELVPGIDARYVPAEGRPEVTRTPFDVARPRSVAYVGRLAELKGVDVLAAAWPVVCAAVPDAHLDVAGDGPLAGLFRDVDGCLLHGQTDRALVASLYDGATVTVVPSRQEAFGMVSMEAMARGRAVVCTPIGEMANRVRDGVDGIHVPAGDAARLASALIDLLTDPDRARAMGEAAADRAESLPTWDDVVDTVIDAYETAQASGTTRRPSGVSNP